MRIVRKCGDLKSVVDEAEAEQKRIAIVPTMGALHEGHLSLVKLAREDSDFVIVSIFVNPTQFTDDDDFVRYPRNLEEDAALLEGAGCHLMFVPDVGEIYPAGFSTTLAPSGVAEVMEGIHRAGHFRGVATIVVKLFNLTRAQVAVFGEKDYQQLAVIRRTVKDLNIPIDIVMAPTSRIQDGLARSSRNLRLSEADRETAGILNKVLKEAASRLLDGESVDRVEQLAATELLSAGFGSVDYLEVRSSEGLEQLHSVSEPNSARIFAAASIGSVRLIDNISVNEGSGASS